MALSVIGLVFGGAAVLALILLLSANLSMMAAMNAIYGDWSAVRRMWSAEGIFTRYAYCYVISLVVVSVCIFMVMIGSPTWLNLCVAVATLIGCVAGFGKLVAYLKERAARKRLSKQK